MFSVAQFFFQSDFFTREKTRPHPSFKCQLRHGTNKISLSDGKKEVIEYTTRTFQLYHVRESNDARRNHGREQQRRGCHFQHQVLNGVDQAANQDTERFEDFEGMDGDCVGPNHSQHEQHQHSPDGLALLQLCQESRRLDSIRRRHVQAYVLHPRRVRAKVERLGEKIV